MKNLWLLAMLFATLVIPLSAQTPEHVYDSGNAFLRLCSKVERTDRTPTEQVNGVECLYFIAGFIGGVEIGTFAARHQTKQPTLPMPFCRPEGVENGQMVKIVLKYVQENPKDAHQPTVFIAIRAFEKAFPCPLASNQ